MALTTVSNAGLAGSIDLTAKVTGTLPIANGGTNSTSTTFVNLASNITGTTPIANGGTAATTLAAAGLANTPAFSAYISSDQTGVGDNVDTLVAFDTEILDSDGTYTNTATNYKFIPNSTGYYYINTVVQIDSNTAANLAEVSLYLYKDGVAVTQARFDDDNDNGDRVTLSSTAVISLTSTERVQVYAGANVGSGTVNFKANSYFQGFKLIGA